jgi:catechol 2,3-dioxygenase-like lactoylglutathione lyase family enzyme
LCWDEKNFSRFGIFPSIDGITPIRDAGMPVRKQLADHLAGKDEVMNSNVKKAWESRRAGERGRLALLALFLSLTAIIFTSDSTAVAGQEIARTPALPLIHTPAAPLSVIQAVDAIGFTVSDLDRAAGFFEQVLSFEKVSEIEAHGDEYERLQGIFGLRMRVARMRLGDEQIELTEYLAPRGRPIPVDSRSNDRSFQHIAIITSDMERAYQWLRKHKVAHASTGPQRLPDWNKNAGGIKAFYFKDPDGHTLEILQFPEGKGDSKWRRLANHDVNRLFLGIDHTAIVVGDTDASLRFYRDALGMRIAGESENYGAEQERLNNVFGARLRITALRAATGPGIEFLEYLAPRDGKLAPPDRKANDLAHWQTKLVAGDIEASLARLRGERFDLVSAGLVRISEPAFGYRRSFLARDPDGHTMQLIEK